jgi:phospholipase/carboxylesterase
MNGALVLQSPPQPRQLFLLFHGVGATPEGLAPIGQRLAAQFPQAAVVAVAAPDRCDLGSGWQWFSVRGVTEQDRPRRVAATLPRFLETVRQWQQQTGVAPQQTTLIGFSQGAIMALEAGLAEPPPAATVVSLAGRFAELPTQPAGPVRFHFIHGDADPVMPVAHAMQAARRLEEGGGSATLDVVPGLGHGVNAEAMERLLQRLRPQPT